MCSATDLLQMSKAKLEDLFLLMVLSEGQSAKIWTNQNLRTEPKSPDRTKISKNTLDYEHSFWTTAQGTLLPLWSIMHVSISVYSQLRQGRLEEGVRVVAVDHLGFTLFGFRGGGHREGG